MFYKKKKQKILCSILYFFVTFIICMPSQAHLIEGSDWNDMDLIVSDCDVLSGIFTNVASFQINQDDLITFSPELSIFANSISLYGSLQSIALSDSTLIFNAQTTIYMDSLSSIVMFGDGNYLEMTANSMTINGTIDIEANPPNTVPIPSSAILLGFGIAGIGLIKKRAKKS